MLNILKTVRADFLDFIKAVFPDGKIVKPSNDSAHYPDSEAVCLEVTDDGVDLFARVLVGTTPIYIERGYKADGSVIYYAKLYAKSDIYGECFTDMIEETEAQDARAFIKAVRAWVK